VPRFFPITWPSNESTASFIKGNPQFWIRARSRKARLDSIVPWVTYSDRTHFFPHAKIASNVSFFMDLVPLPPWGNDFSRKGDSGSWVITTNMRWLGMLVAGNPRHHLSYVVLAEPLINYLESCIANVYGQPSSPPRTYIDEATHME
jgi:hypothetical protein